MTRRNIIAAASALAIGFALSAQAGAEPIRIGLQRITPNGATYIALEKGYFAAEGLAPELVFFESPVPVAMAAVSRDVDFGVAALTGALFTLAGKGGLRIIAAGVHEAPAFHVIVLVAANRAYAAGFTSFASLAGRSIAIPQIGSGPHYALHLLADKYGFDLGSIRVMAMQSNPNAAAAATGGQSDGAMLPWDYVSLTARQGGVEVVGFVGDEVQFQTTAVWTAHERSGVVERFLRAYRKGAREFHDAFADENGRRTEGPGAPEVLAIVAKYTGHSMDEIALGAPYIDREARLDVGDVLRQIAWYRNAGMIKGEIEPDKIIDRRYVTALPETEASR